MLTVDVVIPSTNALGLFQKHLPSIIKNTPNLNQVVIVDNASNDLSIQYAKSLSPKIKVISNLTNNRYTKAVNQGVASSNADLVVILNNDVHVQDNYLKSALNYFKDPLIFAVTLNENSSSYPIVSFDGKFQYARSADKSKPAYSAWASGGSAVFRRSLWQKLGGYNLMYAPGYWEDIDIGWTAWRSGYKIIFDPKSKCEHQHEVSFGQLDKNYLNLIKQRNELLFNWQHFADKEHLQSHIKYLLFYTLLHPGYLKVILSALLRLNQIRTLPKNILSSSQVLRIIYETK